jgi:hypothetical protein
MIRQSVSNGIRTAIMQIYVLINRKCGILFKPEDLGSAEVMMEYDPEGHTGFLDRIFRAAIIRNTAGMPTAISIRGE